MVDPVTATLIGAAIAGGTTLTATAIQAKESVLKYNSEVLNDLNTMKDEYGDGISTLIAIENATGSDMDLVQNKSWKKSHVWKYPLPSRIGPGQTGVFLHVKPSGLVAPSIGALVYRFKGPDSNDYDTYLGWNTPYSGLNNIHNEVRRSGNWGAPGGGKAYSSLGWYVKNKLSPGDETTMRDEYHGCEVQGSIGQNSSPVCTFLVGYAPEKVN